ncbi:unnamed protein product [Brassica rapa subsp. trilocularis]
MDNGFSCYGGETEAVDDDCHVGCKTPTREECRIPVCPPCPPPVRRKRSIHFGKKRETPKNDGLCVTADHCSTMTFICVYMECYVVIWH